MAELGGNSHELHELHELVPVFEHCGTINLHMLIRLHT